MKRGFTLLELVLVLAILSSLVVVTTQSIQRAVTSKTKIQRQIDEMSQVRDALKIIERDINLAFHYRDLEKEFVDEVKGGPPSGGRGSQGGAAASAGGLGGGGVAGATTVPALTPAQQAIQQWVQNMNNPNRQDPTTQFLGKESELAFITLNSSRLNENQLQADFVKVGYVWGDCPPPLNPDSKVKLNEGSKCLNRRQSSIAEGELIKGGESVVLLRNVQEFKLRYIGKGKQDWATTWDTKNGSDASTKDNFPEAVEVSLTIETPIEKGKRKISMQIVVPIRFPNNKAT